MGKQEKDGAIKRLLRSIPGMKARASEGENKDQGNSYEFEATLGQKGDSLGITFSSVAQALARLKKGMKVRVTMVREPGTSWYEARLQFLDEEEGEKTGSGVST